MAYPIHTPARPLYRSIQIIWYIFYIIQIALLVRILLRLIGANSAAPFTRFIYDSTEPLVHPFQNMVTPWRFTSGVFDWNLLIAMFVYWILAWIIVELILMIVPISSYDAARNIREQQHHQ